MRGIVNLKVNELQAELKRRGLNKAGKKSVLVDRLKKALVEEGIDADDFEFEGDVDMSCEEMSQTSVCSQDGDNDSNKWTNADVVISQSIDSELMPPPNPVTQLTVEDTLTMKKGVLSTEMPKPFGGSITPSSSTVSLNGSMVVNMDDDETLVLERELEEEKEYYEDTKEAIHTSSTSHIPTGIITEDDDGMLDTTLENMDNNKYSESTNASANMNGSEESNQKRRTIGNGKRAAKGPDNKIVWVANIGDNVKAVDLKTLFSQCGKVSVARIVTVSDEKKDEEDSKNVCYGYLEMSSFKDVQNCVSELDGIEFKGQILAVSNVFSTAKSKMSATQSTTYDVSKSLTEVVIDHHEDEEEDEDDIVNVTSPPIRMDTGQPQESSSSLGTTTRPERRVLKDFSSQSGQKPFTLICKVDNTKRTRQDTTSKESGKHSTAPRTEKTGSELRKEEAQRKIEAQQKRLEFLERELSRQKQRLSHKEMLLNKIKSNAIRHSNHFSAARLGTARALPSAATSSSAFKKEVVTSTRGRGGLTSRDGPSRTIVPPSDFSNLRKRPREESFRRSSPPPAYKTMRLEARPSRDRRPVREPVREHSRDRLPLRESGIVSSSRRSPPSTRPSMKFPPAVSSRSRGTYRDGYAPRRSDPHESRQYGSTSFHHSRISESHRSSKPEHGSFSSRPTHEVAYPESRYEDRRYSSSHKTTQPEYRSERRSWNGSAPSRPVQHPSTSYRHESPYRDAKTAGYYSEHKSHLTRNSFPSSSSRPSSRYSHEYRAMPSDTRRHNYHR